MWNVSESTVKRWADSGDLQCVKTPGGHRRFSLDEIVRFQRSQGFEAVGSLVSPGETADGVLPELEQVLERRDFDALSQLFADRALEADVQGVGALLARSYLRGISVVELQEKIVTPAMHAIGDRWRVGELTVADEHIASHTAVEALVRLQPEMLRRPPIGRTAVVGCPEDELHEMASRFIGFLLEIEGWTVITLGINTPFFSFRDAVERYRPDLVCISSTMLNDLDRQSREYASLGSLSREVGAQVVIGGAGFAEPSVRARFPHDAYCENLRDLLKFIAKT